MRVVVDYNLCETNARCMKVAPEVFAVDEDEDRMYLVNETPGEDARDKVENAVRLCPKQALSIEESR
jgi:ferredoxin